MNSHEIVNKRCLLSEMNNERICSHSVCCFRVTMLQNKTVKTTYFQHFFFYTNHKSENLSHETKFQLCDWCKTYFNVFCCGCCTDINKIGHCPSSNNKYQQEK